LGRPVHHFAYPNGGGVINHDDRIANLVRNAGFRSATTSVNDVLRQGADPFRISRLGIAQRHSVDGFALNLERDRLFSLGRRGTRSPLLLVGPPPDAPGGISTCVRTILSSAIGTRFEIFHVSPTGALGFHQPRVRAIFQLLRALFMFPLVMLFRRPAIVQVHAAYGNDFWRNAPFVLFSWAGRVPSVLIIHGSRFDRAYQDAGALQRAAIRFILRRPSAVLVRGAYWRDVVQSIAPGLPVSLLPTTTDPVDGSAMDPAVKWLSPTVLFVGGVAAVTDNVRKGLPDLLAIVSKLAAEVPEAKVQIVGPKPGDPWKEVLAPDWPPGRVEFMGSLSHDKIGGLYRGAAVFVLPSHAEGMPNTILEAMAHGLPIVATTVGSIPEVVEHDVGGYLVPPGDAEKLLAALIKVLKDPQAALRMGEHNRALVRDRFTNRHTADRLLAVYANLLSGKRGSS
jgi:glycosyltransferase involved in cell wall biosynthesis